MKAVVLCAGFGTRLGDWTREIPKPMLLLAGKPILGHILTYLAGQGIRDVAVNLHFQPEQIPAYFGDGSEYGIRLHYSREEKLLGTAGALGRLAPWLEDSQDFLVLYGDILTDQDLSPLLELHRQGTPLATLLLHRRKKSNSVVQMEPDGRITRFLERPTEEERAKISPGGEWSWVNSGLQVVNRRILGYISSDAVFDLPRDIYSRVLRDEKILGCPLTGTRIAIDSQDRFLEAEAALRDGILKIRTGG